jgi:hypothetical protein
MNIESRLTKVCVAFAVALVVLSSARVARGATNPPVPGGSTKVVTITDPILDMKAYSLTIPQNWVFQGAVIQGTPCVPGPFSVIRTSSPDGLVGIKTLPRLDWAWSDNPREAKPQTSGGCLDLKKEMSASEVLKYMVGILQVELVKEVPNPNLAELQKNAAANHSPKMRTTVDAQGSITRYFINKLEIEDHVYVLVSCSTYSLPAGIQHNCSAYVSRSWAPKGQWTADTYAPINHSYVIDQQWHDRWNAQMDQQIRDISQRGSELIRAAGERADRQMQAQRSAFEQAQAMRQKQHEDFDASIRRGTEMSMARTQDSMNTRSRAADDWCDYSLDQQKRLDPNTGLITKDSAAYNYTWVNEQGDRVQTNNINANPNGQGTGTWTMQENVR